MFKRLNRNESRPRPFEVYTARELWTDPHIADQMLRYHLDDSTELASRNSRFVERSAKWIIEHFDVGPGTRLCDLGCGPGLYALPLAQTGAEVTGVDFSENSIRYAHDAAVRANVDIVYRVADYLELPAMGPFDLITLIYCDFCALGPDQRQKLLKNIVRVMAPGAYLLLDVCSVALFDASEESMRIEKYPEGGFWTAESHAVRVAVYKYPESCVLLHKHTIVEKSRTRDIYNWIQCYDTESIREELERAGFGVVELFGNVAGDARRSDDKEIAVVARRDA